MLELFMAYKSDQMCFRPRETKHAGGSHSHSQAEATMENKTTTYASNSIVGDIVFLVVASALFYGFAYFLFSV